MHYFRLVVTVSKISLCVLAIARRDVAGFPERDRITKWHGDSHGDYQ